MERAGRRFVRDGEHQCEYRGMATFYFDLHECGDVTLDEEGRELPDLASAERAATQAARAIMCSEVEQGRLCLGCYIAIQDAARREVGRILFRDAITVTGLHA